MANTKVSSEQIIDGLALGGNPTAATQTAGNNSTRLATTAYTDAAITALIGGAPSTLDTLNEIAAAVSDDPDYVGTVNAALALKAPKASPTFTGTATMGGLVVDGNGDVALAWASGSTHKVGSSFSTTYYTGMRVSADSRNTDIISLDASGIGNVNIFTGPAETKRVSVNPSGDISFYDDSGNAKFFWDASAESLGIGTSTPAETLHISHATAPKMRFERNGAYYWDIGHTGSDFQFESQTGGTILHLNFDGNAGFGTSSPQTSLSIETSGMQDVVSPIVTGQSSGVTYGGLYTVRDGAGDQRGLALKVYTANVGLNEVMRISSSGNVSVANGDINLNLPSIAGSRYFDVTQVNATNAKTRLKFSGTADWRQTLSIQMNTAQSDTAPVDVVTISNSGNVTVAAGLTVGSQAAGNKRVSFYDFDDSSATRAYIEYNDVTDVMTIRARNADTIILDNGVVTMPYQPAFCVYNPPGVYPDATTSSAFGKNWTSNSFATHANVGGHFSTTTGRFTAPVAGSYYFSFSCMIDTNSANNTGFDIKKNGVAVNGGEGLEILSAAPTYQQLAGSILLTLAVNDYVEVQIRGGRIHQRYGSFEGYLIG